MKPLHDIGKLLLFVLVLFGVTLETFAESNNSPHSCFNMESPYIVICRNRNLTEIPEDFPKNITRFFFDGNQLSTLKNDFSSFTKLKVAKLARNNLTSIEKDAFQNMHSLWELVLEGNHLSVLPESLLRLPSLRDLNLKSNRFTTFKYSESIWPLEILYLGENPLTSFITLGKNQLLYHLNLTLTNITTITVKDLRAIPKLTHLEFDGTPFYENFVKCDDKDLIDYILCKNFEIFGRKYYANEKIPCIAQKTKEECKKEESSPEPKKELISNGTLESGTDLNRNGTLESGTNLKSNVTLESGTDLNSNGTLESGTDLNRNGTLEPGTDLNQNENNAAGDHKQIYSLLYRLIILHIVLYA